MICPVDPYVEDDYFQALKKLETLAAEGNSNLVLMGIEPTYPSEKYGYIIPESGEKIASVSTFKEKPTTVPLRNISKRARSGTAACSLFGFSSCWIRPMSS